MARGKKVETVGKKRKKSSSQRTYIKRVCKASDLLMVNRDGLQLVEGAYRDFLTGLLNHTEIMMRDNKHRLTRDTARLAFIGYMDKMGGPSETTQEALEHADNALKSLFPSE